MKLEKILPHLESLAPPHLAEPWENVGLLVGDPDAEITRVLLTIDYTPAVADEAKSLGCEMVVAYHPPIFKELKRLVAPNLIHDAIRRGIAIYSPHTALDVADGGTNDLLADVLGMTDDRQPLKKRAQVSNFLKLVTFIPKAHVDSVRDALFAAGAGRLGHYEHCSFAAAGTGTFRGDEATHPAIGRAGRLEHVDEVRVEMLAPKEAVNLILAALQKTHPYEEPAYDLFALQDFSSPVGIGRIGPIKARSRVELLLEIKRELKLDHLLVAGSMDGIVSRAACCAGSCGELLNDALSQKAELFLTGEMRHHDALRAAAAGMTVVCTLHSNSERPALSRLVQRLSAALPELVLTQSLADRDPFSVH